MTHVIETHNNKHVYEHEESFRRKTNNFITNMISKDKDINEKKGGLLINVGEHFLKVSEAIRGLEQKSGRNILGTLNTKAAATNDMMTT